MLALDDSRCATIPAEDSVEMRRRDPEFRARVRRIIKEDPELLERLARRPVFGTEAE